MNETTMNGMGYPMNHAAVTSVPVAPMQTAPMVVTEQTENVEKMYNIRGLGAKDIFPMVNIIRKIGLKDFGKCFEPEEIRAITETFSEKDDIAKTVGVSVVIRIVDVILENLAAVEQEIFGFLGGLTDLSVDDVANLPMDVFFELVVDVFQRKEFVGFMRAVSRLLK